jgi:hypothetical protein
MSRVPALQAPSVASPASAPEVPLLVAQARQAAETLLAPLLATGCCMAEAIGLTASVHGREALRPALDAHLATYPAVNVAATFLDGVATHDPVLAQEGLDAWFACFGAATPHPDGVDLRQLAWVTHLPEGLVVEGDLELGGTAITELPANLHVTDSIDLRWTPVRSLPKGLVVPLTLALSGCVDLVRLPEGLRVGTNGMGHLELKGCADLEELPQGVVVAGMLDLRGTGVRRLASDLSVGDLLLDSACPLFRLTDAEILKIAPGIRGRIRRQ